jgi:hypothetical protein
MDVVIERANCSTSKRTKLQQANELKISINVGVPSPRVKGRGASNAGVSHRSLSANNAAMPCHDIARAQRTTGERCNNSVECHEMTCFFEKLTMRATVFASGSTVRLGEGAGCNQDRAEAASRRADVGGWSEA